MENRNLTVGEAATFMGVKERFIRRLVAERRIAFLKLGKHIRIPEQSIVEFEASGRIEKSK
jgi:excisionase family DNA binding protein